MMMMREDIASPSSAFTNGYECGRTGTARTANPHAAQSAEAQEWLKGWDEGSAKRDWVNAKPDPDAPANG
jgi:ribosome modulation factor